jgi:hypothetical protein
MSPGRHSCLDVRTSFFRQALFLGTAEVDFKIQQISMGCEIWFGSQGLALATESSDRGLRDSSHPTDSETSFRVCTRLGRKG